MGECDDELSKLEKILLKYPGLVTSESKNKETILQGRIKLKNSWIRIKIIFYNFPHVNNFQLQVQESFNIKTFTNAELDISTDWSIEELLENIPNLIKSVHNSSNASSNKCRDVQTNIYAEIANLYAPTEYEILLNDNCSLIQFRKFLQHEQHFLEVVLPNLQLMEHSLPSCIEWKEFFGRANSLTELVLQYRSCLEDLRQFYESFTDIDELCHVVQPSLPATKENWRIFVLKDRVFLKVQFKDPFSPLTSMSVHIIGPTTEVAQLRRVYSEGMRDWDSDLDVHKNLLRIFDLCFFPMTPTEDSHTAMSYCNICYCYKLDHGEIPIVSCDNIHCSLMFHAACLKEWFNTLTDGKTFLNVAFGTCPFCKAKLSTSFQEILA